MYKWGPLILNLWSLQNLKLIHRARLWLINAFIWMPDFIKTSTLVCRGRWRLAVIVSQRHGEQMDSVSHLSAAIASFPCATRWVVMTTKSSYSELSIVCSAQTTDWSTSPPTHTLSFIPHPPCESRSFCPAAASTPDVWHAQPSEDPALTVAVAPYVKVMTCIYNVQSPNHSQGLCRERPPLWFSV